MRTHRVRCAFPPEPRCSPGACPHERGFSRTQVCFRASRPPTFVHSLEAAGYECILCGRMHFMGQDQRHGFEQRTVGDFTPCYHGRYGKVRSDLGPYVGTPGGEFTKHYGGGSSPVLEYDRAVVESAVEILQQPHERPLFLMIGTYGPHHTYVAPKKLYEKYFELVDLPESDRKEIWDSHPAIDERMKKIDRDVSKSLRAAYWGKMTFYDLSAKIPFVFHGNRVVPGRRVDTPSSIMDLGPTLCDIADAPMPPEQDGIVLRPVLEGGVSFSDRSVISELLEPGSDPLPARMLRRGQWKLVSYADRDSQDLLFDMNVDPGEYHNRVVERRDVAAVLREELDRGWDPDHVAMEHRRRKRHWDLLSKWGATAEIPEPDRWKVPRSSWELPEP